MYRDSIRTKWQSGNLGLYAVLRWREEGRHLGLEKGGRSFTFTVGWEEQMSVFAGRMETMRHREKILKK